MTYGLFFGCVIPNNYPGVEYAVRWLFSEAGFEVDYCDIPKASCCPAPGIYYSTDKETWLTLAARNLCLAQDLGVEIVAVCNSCFGSLKKATNYLENPNYLGKANKHLSLIGKKYRGILTIENDRRVYKPIPVKHFVDVMYSDIGIKAIKDKVVKPLTNIKIAVQYGCHYLRPTESLRIDDSNSPKKVDELVNALGCVSVDYDTKYDCCGGGIRAELLEISTAMAEDKLKGIQDGKADVIVTPCPYCLLQLDKAQRRLRGVEIPVIHISQLIALALGVNPLFLGFETHSISVNPFLRKIVR